MPQGNKPPWLKPYAMKDNPEPLGEQTLTGISAPRSPETDAPPTNIQASLAIRKGPQLNTVNLSNDQLSVSLGNSREESEIHLADPMISKRQLVIMRLGREFIIVDCGVNDMVRVDGVPTRQAVVPVGQRVVIDMGNTAMFLSSQEDPPGESGGHDCIAPRPGSYPDDGHLPDGQITVNTGGSQVSSRGHALVLGADKACDFNVRGGAVQPIHALIAYTPAGISLVNLASGEVFVNKQEVSDVVVINPEDDITVGGRKVELVFSGDPHARAAAIHDQNTFTFNHFAFTSLNAAKLRSFTVPTSGEAHTVGRSPTCDVVLEETSVSRVHAQIIPSGKSFYLIDNYSSNGTYVNDVKISKRRIRAGDVVEFGRNPFLVHYT